MSWLRPQTALDRTFQVGIVLKGLNGVLELFGGILLLTIPPATISHILTALTQGELSKDPRDLIASQLLTIAHHLTTSTELFGALYLLSHAIVKIVLVVAVLQQKLWAYPWMIGFLTIFIAYQTYRLTFAPSGGLALLTAFDACIVWLTYVEYRQHQKKAALRT